MWSIPFDEIRRELCWIEDMADVERRLSGQDLASEKDLLAAIQTGAEPVYRRLWSALSTRERIALYELAHGRLIDFRARGVLSTLHSRGLIERSPDLALRSRTFARFVQSAEREETIELWRGREEESSWVSLRPWLGAIGTAGLGILVVAGGETVTATLTLVSSLVASPPLLARTLTALRGLRGDSVDS